METIKSYWEERAKHYKTDVRGVLFKRPYPSFVNSSFHRWTLSLVDKLIIKNKKTKILDVACGWGRVSGEILKKHELVELSAVDISSTYVEFYNQMLSPSGKAVVGDMTKLSFKDKSFDAAFLIASLMYLTTKNSQIKAVSEILRTLKKKGKFLLIERTPWMGIFDITQKLKRRRGSQVSFTSKNIHALIKSTGGKVIRIHSWPFNFFPLYKAYLIQKI